MHEDHYPTIDKEFMHELIIGSKKLEGVVRAGTTTAYIIKGLKPISKRTLILRETDGQVGFMHATGCAVILGVMGKLLKWYEENKNWKDGAYILNDQSDSEEL